MTITYKVVKIYKFNAKKKAFIKIRFLPPAFPLSFSSPFTHPLNILWLVFRYLVLMKAKLIGISLFP